MADPATPSRVAIGGGASNASASLDAPGREHGAKAVQGSGVLTGRDDPESARAAAPAAGGSQSYGITRENLMGLMEDKNVGDLESQFGGVEGVSKALLADQDRGLTEAAVQRSRAKFGDNVLPHKPPKSFFVHLLESLQDLTLIILILASVMTIFFGVFLSKTTSDIIQGIAILIAVMVVSGVTSTVNYIQDAKFDELSRTIEDRLVQVRRIDANGRSDFVDISIHDVVVGDIMRVRTGEVLPCDGLFVRGAGIVTDESAMTGEPKQIHKGRTKPFMVGGSKVEGGAGEMMVITVGPDTSYGKIVKALQEEESPDTPLQGKLNILAQQIGYLGMFFGAATFIVLIIAYYMVDRDRTNAASDIVGFFIIGITIVVVAVPEGLPLAVTISLSFSMQSMTKDQNLVRELAACETMGSATCICSDKTGTLTTNRMTVVGGYFFGNFAANSLPAPGNVPQANKDILNRCIALNSDADVSEPEEAVQDGLEQPLVYTGNKSECAMLGLLTRHFGLDYRRARAEAGEAAFIENFSSARKRMSAVFPVFAGDEGPSLTKMQAVKDAINALPIEQRASATATAERTLSAAVAHSSRHITGEEAEPSPLPSGMAAAAAGGTTGGTGSLPPGADSLKPERLPVDTEEPEKYVVYCKGASEILLGLCVSYLDNEGNAVELDAEKRAEMESHIDAMATSGLRTLCICRRVIAAEDAPSQLAVEAEAREMAWKAALEHIENQFELVGIVGIKDPVRKQVPNAVRQCKEAGVRVRMVTGDNLKTARFIAQECGIVDAQYQECMEGKDFRRMERADRAAWLKMLPNLAVLARSSPTDKLLLVNGLKELGDIVSVTGDGTNDAPALRAAHVGLSMGIAGTEVAKEASKIVIMDDNFASCVSAIKWGRSVLENIRKFLVFQLTINVVALSVTFVVACVNGFHVPSSEEEYDPETNTTVLVEGDDSIAFPITPVQLLWINLIMDSFAALALATEPPSNVLLRMRPAGKDTPLTTKIMVKMMVGHSVWQTAIVLFLTLSEAGNKMYGVDTNGSIEHYTCIFNTFVWLQLFNELNARKIHDEINILEGFFESSLTVLMTTIIIVLQAILVSVGGDLMSTVSLNGVQWIVCIAIGATSIPVGYILRVIPYYDEDDQLATLLGFHGKGTAAAKGSSSRVVELKPMGDSAV